LSLTGNEQQATIGIGHNHNNNDGSDDYIGRCYTDRHRTGNSRAAATDKNSLYPQLRYNKLLLPPGPVHHQKLNPILPTGALQSTNRRVIDTLDYN